MTPSPLELLLAGRYRELYALLHDDGARGRLLAEFAGAANAQLTDRQLDMRASGDFAWGLLSLRQRRAFLTRDAAVAFRGPGLADAGRAQRAALRRLRASLDELYDALDVALAEADLDWLLPLAEHLVSLQEFSGDLEPALAQYEALLGVAERLRSSGRDAGATELELHARLGLSVALLRLGRYSNCRAQAESAAGLAQELGRQALLAAAWHMAGTALSMLGDFGTAATELQRALELRRTLGERHAAAASIGNLAYARAQLGDVDSARALLREGYALCEQLGELRGAATFLTNLGSLDYEAREYAGARGSYQRACAALRQLGDERGIAAALSGSGYCDYGLGDLDSARSSQSEALGLARQLGDPYLEFMALNALGNIEFTAGNYQPALEHYSTALQACRASGDRQGIARSLCGAANAALQLGSPQPHNLAAGLALFIELGDSSGMIDALAYSALYLAGTAPDNAAAALRTALHAAQAGGYEFDRADQLVVAQARELLAAELAGRLSAGDPPDLKAIAAQVVELLRQQ